MLRVTGWTVGLFGAGAAISRFFTSPWAEPIVLLALGMAFLFVSRRTGRTAAPQQEVVAKLPARAVLPKSAPAAVRQPVPVEQSA
ncbi:MAG TPA: hypothetical protein VIW03_10820 [Anaeromyxobacter sp.]